MAGAQVAVGMALVIIVVGVARTVLAPMGGPGILASALALGLEFLLAAGLIRLAARPGVTMLGVVALVIVVRRVIAAGLRYAQVALMTPAPRPARR